ncbi:MAG: hypothetical protein ACXVCY_00735 [Pseudobdellovibrionaceae bacterium]
MLRKKLLLLFFIFLSWMNPTNSYATHNWRHLMPGFQDRVIVWPWALALPFPWADISGLWKAEDTDSDFVSYFTFDVVCQNAECNCETYKSICQLRVRQFDATNCKTLAAGAGIESTHVVLAQMTSISGLIYRIHLTAFSEKDSPLPPLKSDVPFHGVMVLSMGPLDAVGPEDMVHMQIKKISSSQAERFCLQGAKK